MNSTNLKLIFCVNFQCEHLTCLNIWFYNLNKFYNDVKWCFFDLNECQMLISLSNENVLWIILWIWLEFWMNNFFGFGFGPPQNDRLTDTHSNSLQINLNTQFSCGSKIKRMSEGRNCLQYDVNVCFEWLNMRLTQMRFNCELNNIHV